MEQKDFLMREIEKIGLLLRSLLGILLNKRENLAIEIPNPFEQTNECLINETGFHLDELLTLDAAATREYISKFNGLNASNLELLAEIIFQLGIAEPSAPKRNYLEKALQLYELCISTDKTFSAPRDKRITEIRNML